MNEHRQDIDAAARIVRGQAPARAVSVQRAVAFSGRLTHQLDYVVLLHVYFAINSGMQVTVPKIVASLRDAGIRSAKSGNELVGRDAVYESFARIIEAGFIRRTTIPNPKGKGYRGLTSYEVFDHFEDNPDYSPQPTRRSPGPNFRCSRKLLFPQVSPLPVFAETRKLPVFAEAQFADVEDRSFPQVSPRPRTPEVEPAPPHTPRRR